MQVKSARNSSSTPLNIRSVRSGLVFTFGDGAGKLRLRQDVWTCERRQSQTEAPCGGFSAQTDCMFTLLTQVEQVEQVELLPPEVQTHRFEFTASVPELTAT